MAKSVLDKERAETKKRVAELKGQTKFEQLQKEEIECKRELVILKRLSIVDWIKRLFKERR